jgi:glutamyl-tRNA synthetase
MIELFSLERVNKAPASFDPKKLSAFQDHYMQAVPIDQKTAMVIPYLQKAGVLATPPVDWESPKTKEILRAAGDRIKVAGDIVDYADFFVPDDRLQYDEAAFEKRIRKPPEADELLRKFRNRLTATAAFDAPTLDEQMQEFVKSEGIAVGQIIHALRVAVTGKAVGFGLFDSLAILGREHSLARVDRALARL